MKRLVVYFAERLFEVEILDVRVTTMAGVSKNNPQETHSAGNYKRVAGMAGMTHFEGQRDAFLPKDGKSIDQLETRVCTGRGADFQPKRSWV